MKTQDRINEIKQMMNELGSEATPEIIRQDQSPADVSAVAKSLDASINQYEKFSIATYSFVIFIILLLLILSITQQDKTILGISSILGSGIGAVLLKKVYDMQQGSRIDFLVVTLIAAGKSAAEIKIILDAIPGK